MGLNEVFKKVAGIKSNATELASHEVELFKVEDTIKLYEKGVQQLKDADAEKVKLAQLYSRALIILEMNVPAQLDDSIKKLIDLGINDKAAELKSQKDKSLKLASEYSKLYQLLK
jgi:hypothetical protein